MMRFSGVKNSVGNLLLTINNMREAVAGAATLGALLAVQMAELPVPRKAA